MEVSAEMGDRTLGDLLVDRVAVGDCRKLIHRIPDESVDVVVTSPPYWGQRLSDGTGIEDDPREYVETLASFFSDVLYKLNPTGLLWINLGDAYNTPINWREGDHLYSSLGPDKSGLPSSNSAYTKPRHKRRAFIDRNVPWLSYGNLLAIPYRLTVALCDAGWLFRGEVVWRKLNPMPEGRCRRPHRQHEPILLFARSERHRFQTQPPVPSVWEFPNEKISGAAHFSRFPEELPRRCIAALGECTQDTIVMDPFAGSGTTGLAAIKLGGSFVGFEIDEMHAAAANERLGHLDGRFKI